MMIVDRAFSQKLERTEARANADFVETRARLEPGSGAGWKEVGGAYAMFDGVGSPLTQSFGLGIFEEPTNDHFDEIEDFFRTRGSDVFHEVSPLTDQSLLSTLSERGYRPVELTSVMYLDLKRYTPADLINPDIRARPISERDADLWAETAAAGWETVHAGLGEFMLEIGKIAVRASGAIPHLAELNGRAIAAGGLQIYDDVAIMAGAATIPEARRLGAQNALLRARLLVARQRGCALAMMCALPGSQSQSNAQRNGFQIAYTRTKWHLPL